MFSNQQQKTRNEIDILFEKNPKPSLEEILACQCLVSQFRDNNEKLVARLMDEEVLKDLYHTVMITKEKSMQKLITSLFQTSNYALHEVFIKNLRITEYAISALDLDTVTGKYAVGVISRFISRALDTWPEETSELFRVSKVIYPTIIKHIDESCVFQAVTDLINDTHPGITLFMWHLFMRLSKKRYIGKDRPQCVFLEPDLEINFELNESHKHNIIEILKLFFEYKNGKAEGFENCMMEFISETDELIPSLFEVAKHIGPNNKVAQRTIEYIKKYYESDMCPLEKAISYLSICIDLIPIEIHEAIIFFSLTNERVTNFVLLSGEELAASLCKSKSVDTNSIKKNLTSIVAYAWNNMQNKIQHPESEQFHHLCPSVLVPFILDVGILLIDAETDVKGWKDFVCKLLSRWKSGTECEAADEFGPDSMLDLSFVFESGDWDQPLISKLTETFFNI